MVDEVLEWLCGIYRWVATAGLPEKEGEACQYLGEECSRQAKFQDAKAE